MKSIKQLLRQPLKTLSGMVLIALAVAILITCVGQYAAAGLTRADIENDYDTIVLATQDERYLPYNRLSAYLKWYRETLETRTDLIKTISETGLISGYIPELTPDNYTRHYTMAGESYTTQGIPYTCAMLVVTLEELKTEVTEEKNSFTTSDGFFSESLRCVSVLCKGSVEQVVSLQEGFNNPEGYTIDLTFRVANMDAFDAMGLEEGGRYLVYGMEYSDNDWSFRRLVSPNAAIFEEPIDMSKIQKDHPLGPEYETSDNIGTDFDYYVVEVRGEMEYRSFWAESISRVHNCALLVCDYAALPDHIMKYGEDNLPVGYEALVDQRVLQHDETSDILHQQNTTLMDADSFMEMYSLPTIVKLDGSVEEFLASTEGELWRKVLDNAVINNHTFPVLAVEKLGYQAEFVRGNARIVEGRAFSEDELTGGGKVCVIAQSLAVANGLTVGDTITLRALEFDPNVNDRMAYFYPEESYPFAYYYSDVRGFDTEPESYTIIGLYRQNNEWDGRSPYGFNPNTVFIPKTSTEARMILGDRGTLRSVILYNEKGEEFTELLKSKGFSDLLVCYDQGYSEIAKSLDAYEVVSSRALYVGIGAWLVLLILFVILFPARQGERLATMHSLGASRGSRMGHVMASALGILIPGTVMGWAAGSALWERVAAELMQSVGVSLTLVSDGTVMTLASAVQLIAAAAVIFITALVLTRERIGGRA